MCLRIHPCDKRPFLAEAIEKEKRLREFRLNQVPRTSPQSALGFSARYAEPTISLPPIDSPQAITQVKLPPTITTAKQLITCHRNKSHFRKNPASSASLQQHPIQAPEDKSHDDVHNWDVLDGLHPVSKSDGASSDTSSVSEDLAGKYGEPSWDAITGVWETNDGNSVWSDSDGTIEDVQTSSKGRQLHRFGNEAPIFVTSSSVVEQKHPRPKYNERCRNWLRDQCDRGYQCMFVHEDLDYDDLPVSFNLLPCQYFNVRFLPGTPGSPREFFDHSS